jgi:Holliday junction resolvasome RuvABC DNA-binding subunit
VLLASRAAPAIGKALASRAERKAGQLLSKTPKSKPGTGSNQHKKVEAPRRAELATKAAALETLGISTQQASTGAQHARMAADRALCAERGERIFAEH